MALTGISTRPAGSDGYWPPVGTRVPWVLAQPIQDLLDQDTKYAEFSNLGIEGNLEHLKKHGGHTPWRAGSKHGIIWAKDTHCPPGFREWLIAKCKSDYVTTWIRFFNIEGGQYDNAGNWLQSSTDEHFHCEVQDGHENEHVTLFIDFIKETQPQENAVAIEAKLDALLNMFVEGTSPTGTETTGGGIDRIWIYKHMDEIEKRTSDKIAAVGAKLDGLPEAIRAAVAAMNISLTPEQLKQLEDGIVAGVNRPASGTWSTNPEV